MLYLGRLLFVIIVVFFARVVHGLALSAILVTGFFFCIFVKRRIILFVIEEGLAVDQSARAAIHLDKGSRVPGPVCFV